MKSKLIRKSNKGFTLIEMIGVLAIIGILASVVAPKVIEAIRDAKVTSTLANLSTIKSAALNYYARYSSFVPDGTKKAVNAGTSDGWTRTYGEAIQCTDLNTTFGDILMSEGLLERVSSSLGNSGTKQGSPIPSTAAKVNADTSGANYPEVLCKRITSADQFSAAQNATYIIFFRIPSVSLLEAAAIKTKVDGPFTAAQVSGYVDLVTQACNNTGNVSGIKIGNCRLEVDSGSVGQAGSTYNVYLYAAHQ
jgi:prepilin-type N-terminal cleavage/methylation domain-containing protein